MNDSTPEKSTFLQTITLELERLRLVLRYAPAELKPEALDVWGATLWTKFVRQEELVPVFREWLATETDFPTPADIVGLVYEMRENPRR